MLRLATYTAILKDIVILSSLAGLPQKLYLFPWTCASICAFATLAPVVLGGFWAPFLEGEFCFRSPTRVGPEAELTPPTQKGSKNLPISWMMSIPSMSTSKMSESETASVWQTSNPTYEWSRHRKGVTDVSPMLHKSQATCCRRQVHLKSIWSLASHCHLNNGCLSYPFAIVGHQHTMRLCNTHETQNRSTHTC